MNKRGMSPIIATILLIAFAVAIGAMIMNWSATLVTASNQESSCEDAKISLRRPLCYENSKIRMEMISVPSETPIEGIVMSISSPESDQDIHVKNSRLTSNDVVVREVPVIKPKDFTIMLHAKLLVDDEEIICPDFLHTTKELPSCN